MCNKAHTAAHLLCALFGVFHTVFQEAGDTREICYLGKAVRIGDTLQPLNCNCTHPHVSDING